MSHLPPKPDFEPQDREKYPPDDRQYPRSYPPPLARHGERERSYREHADSYVPTRPRSPDSYIATDSYVAPAYERRHDDRPRNHDGIHHTAARQTWEPDSRTYPRGWRDGYDRRDPPPRHREHDWRTRDDPVERRREWETRRDYPPSRSHPREHHRDYRRDREYEQRPREDERRYRRESSPSERRWSSRASVSPSRRSDARRRSPPPQRRSVSPPARRSRPPRSPLPSRNDEASHPPTPRGNAVVDSRSVSTTPRDRHGPDRARNRRSPSPRRASSNSPAKGEKDHLPAKKDHKSSDLKPELYQSSASRPESPYHSPKAKSRSPLPVEHEPLEDLKEAPKDKGKARVPANSSTGADGDIKMREPPSPPKQPRATTVASSSSRTVEVPPPTYPKSFRRSPPTGPRNHTKVANSDPNSPAATFQSAPAGFPSKPEWSRRESIAATPLQSQKSVGAAENNAFPPNSESVEPVIQLPVIPTYQPNASINSAQDVEIKELQSHRVRVVAEYAEISKAARRAVHELEMSNVDLNAARMRREIADAQMEKARIGLLGLDYEGVFSD